jgi:hypothetical protein
MNFFTKILLGLVALVVVGCGGGGGGAVAGDPINAYTQRMVDAFSAKSYAQLRDMYSVDYFQDCSNRDVHLAELRGAFEDPQNVVIALQVSEVENRQVNNAAGTASFRLHSVMRLYQPGGDFFTEHLTEDFVLRREGSVWRAYGNRQCNE